MDLESTQTIIKNLCDKSADKRKIATKEIEKQVKILILKNSSPIKKLLETFQNELINSNNQSNRKGGLIGFAAVAIALAQENNVSGELLPNLLNPVLVCMRDTDAKIRFQACESLYNIVKALREISLQMFNEIFDQLARMIADLDEDVRKSAHVLDRMLKDVVLESASNSKYFNLNKFINHLCQTIKAQNPLIRKFLISWITILENIPNINMLNYLPSFLEQLFFMLGDVNKDIRESADVCLMDFLKEIKESPKGRTVELDNDILNILVKLCSGKIHNLTKLTALLWLHDYLKIFLYEMEDGSADENDKPKTEQGEVKLNSIPSLNPALCAKLADIIRAVLLCLSDDEDNIKKAAVQINKVLHQIVNKSNGANIDFKSIIHILKDMLTDSKTTTTESALIWMKQLINMFCDQVIPLIDDVIHKIIEKLQDSEEIIVQNAVDLLGTLSLFENNFNIIISKILNVFQTDEYILNNKSYTILKKLSSILDPVKVFTTFAEQLLKNDDYRFVSLVVLKLDSLLLTDKDLSELRKRLINIIYEDTNSELNKNFFETLYKTWSFNPVSTVLLCLLTQQYELSYYVIMKMADLDVEVDTLIQIAKIVQLLESPIFVYLRLQLLECDDYPFLLKSLQGLLMLLPQGKAFTVLKQRLKYIHFDKKDITKSVIIEKKKAQTRIDLKYLLEVFDKNQKKIADQKLQKKQLKEQASHKKSGRAALMRIQDPPFEIIQLEKRDEEIKAQE